MRGVSRSKPSLDQFGKFSRNGRTGLVLGPGPSGRCDDYRVGGAVVDCDPIGGLWRMWYYCRDRAFDPAAPSTLGSGRIALATSPDGISWTRIDGACEHGAVFAPSADPAAFDSLHVGLTDVSRGAGEWLMWYFGGDRTPRRTEAADFGTVVGLGLRPGLARSSDGVTWQRVVGDGPGGALLDFAPNELYAAWPNAFFDGRRYLLHTTAPTLDMHTYATMIAESEDGRRWRKIGPLIWADGPRPYDVTGIITRQVLANSIAGGKRWLMVYTGTDAAHRRAISAAESDDGISWTHVGDGPIFGVGAPGAWDDFGVAATRLVVYGSRLYLYYYGFQSLTAPDGMRGIGLAISETGGLGDFKRVRA